VTLPIAVFASGGGTNLQALLDHFAEGAERPARIVLVVSDREGAGALERARRAGVEARVIPVAGQGAGEVGEEMLGALREAGAELVVLAGYLRLMPEEVVRAYRGRMINIHPALLPAFGGRGMYGLRIHRAVLEAGCRVSGVTIHYVDERYDTGPVIIQWPVPVLVDDTPESLAARVLAVEHRLLPMAVEYLAGGVRAGEPVRASGSGVPARGSGAGASRELVFGLREDIAPSEGEIRRLLGSS
jgi:formyltetrahydrofolate-dependent phosphoribosylglycinamide formyltransferase